MSNRLKILLVLLVALFLAAGCSKAVAQVTPLPGLEYPDGNPVELKNNPHAVNVTYPELAAFLVSIEKPKGDCLTVAVTLHDAAEAQGIRAGILIMRLPAGFHVVTVFQTADQGIEYADFNYDRQLVSMAGLIERYTATSGVYEFW